MPPQNRLFSCQKGIGIYSYKDFDLCETAGPGRVDLRDDLHDTALDEFPSPQDQYHDRDFPAREVLLIAEILIGGDQPVEASGLSLL